MTDDRALLICPLSSVVRRRYFIPTSKHRGISNGLRRVARAAGADQGTLQGRSPSRRDHAESQGRARRHQYRLQGRDQLDIPLRSGAVSAEGDLDFRGTLGVAKEAPVGFAQIRLRFDLDTDAPQDKLDQLLKLTERYCVVYQTIRSGPPVEITLKRQ